MTNETLETRTVYLAAPFARQGEMRDYRDILRGLGFKVECRWLDELAPSDNSVSSVYLGQAAMDDYEDVYNADMFIVFPGVGAGHHTEFGIAMSFGKQLVVIGKRNNVFHHIKEVFHYEDFAAFINAYEWGLV